MTTASEVIKQANKFQEGSVCNEFGTPQNASEWDNLKRSGSAHYKTGGGVEPVDLYLAGGMFKDFALCSIIKYAFRQRNNVNTKDLNKIIDYAEKLKASLTV